MKYRKKPVVIEAVQFVDTEESILKLSELGLDPVRIDYADLNNPVLKIETLEGLMIATEGDYIIKGVKGEFYPCKPDIFEETYEELEYLNILDTIQEVIQHLDKQEQTAILSHHSTSRKTGFYFVQALKTLKAMEYKTVGDDLKNRRFA